MRLLILTQAIDLDDPVLGFFHQWTEVLAAESDTVSVVCLKAGRRALPANVQVFSLGKESGRSRLKYMFNFYRYLWKLRGTYDAVFVHMNQEYVLLAGIFWRLSGKRIVLWRNHKMGTPLTRLAAFFANIVCYTSSSAYVTRFKNSIQMPIGIDTELFSPGGAPQKDSLLFLGRLDEVKKPDVFLEALRLLQKENEAIRTDFYGEPTPGREAYANELKKRFADVQNVRYHGNIRNADTPPLYRSHAVYVNLTPSGSFDKTIGEAMACGALVVCVNDAVRDVVPEKLTSDGTPEGTAGAIRIALSMTQDEYAEVTSAGRSYVVREHSLDVLTEKLVPLLA